MARHNDETQWRETTTRHNDDKTQLDEISLSHQKVPDRINGHPV